MYSAHTNIPPLVLPEPQVDEAHNTSTVENGLLISKADVSTWYGWGPDSPPICRCVMCSDSLKQHFLAEIGANSPQQFTCEPYEIPLAFPVCSSPALNMSRSTDCVPKPLDVLGLRLASGEMYRPTVQKDPLFARIYCLIW